jgi:hypothetical protein
MPSKHPRAPTNVPRRSGHPPAEASWRCSVTCPCRTCPSRGQWAFRDRGCWAFWPCRHAGRPDPAGWDAARTSRRLPETGDGSPEDSRVGCSAGLPPPPTPRVPEQPPRWRRVPRRAHQPGRGRRRPRRQAVRQLSPAPDRDGEAMSPHNPPGSPGPCLTNAPHAQTDGGGSVVRLEAPRAGVTGPVGGRSSAGMINPRGASAAGAHHE